jgi:hypothetical protein
MGQSLPGEIDHKTLSRKNPSQKRAGGVAQGVGPEFKPQYYKRKEGRKEWKKGGRDGGRGWREGGKLITEDPME